MTFFSSRCYALHQYFPLGDNEDGDLHESSKLEEQDVKMSSMVRKLLMDMKKQNEDGADADKVRWRYCYRKISMFHSLTRRLAPRDI